MTEHRFFVETQGAFVAPIEHHAIEHSTPQIPCYKTAQSAFYA